MTFSVESVLLKRSRPRRRRKTFRPHLERRRKLGLCTRCETPALPGQTKCEQHRAEAARYSQWQRNEGLV